MNRRQFANFMNRIFDTEIIKLREAGQNEYAGGDDNAFGNFERLSKSLNMDPKKVLWVYAKKHIDGIEAYLRGHVSQREPVEGRINDLIVYAFLLRGLIEQDRLRSTVDQSVSESSGSSALATDGIETLEDRSTSQQAR